MSRVYVPIAGTWARKKQHRWHKAGSPFDRTMAGLGLTRDADTLGFWDTSIGGVSFCGNSHASWQYGGACLARFLEERDPASTAVVIAHSHGGQVAAYAATLRRIGVLITVDTPIRADMEEKWEAADIGYHLHLYGTGIGSRMRVFGAGLRSWFSLRAHRRTMPWADQNVSIRGGHSGILRDEKHMHQWGGIIAMVDNHLL